MKRPETFAEKFGWSEQFLGTMFMIVLVGGFFTLAYTFVDLMPGGLPVPKESGLWEAVAVASRLAFGVSCVGSVFGQMRVPGS